MSRRSLSILAALVAVALCALAVWNLWPQLRRDGFYFRGAVPSSTDYPVRGIDVSAHNGDINFDLLAEQPHTDFAYIKATEGGDFADRKFIANYQGFRRVGIPVGAYHFFRFDTDGEMQAWNFINALRGRRFDLPPMIDVESWGNPSGHSPQKVVRELRRMLAILDREGFTPLIYTNKDGHADYIAGRLDAYPLWICSFSNPPLPGSSPVSPAIWQYSHRGSVAGISGPVDLNAAPAAFLPR